MQRTMQAVLIALLLAIGLTAGSLAWRMTTFDRTTTALGTADPAVGYAFYDGINQILAGKGRDSLDRITGQGFVEHDGTQELDSSAAEMVDRLTAFAASFPGTQVVVNEIAAAPGTLVASIGPLAPVGGAVAGMPMTMQPLGGGYDVLRVRDGKVIERWSGDLPDLELRTLDDAAFQMGADFNDSIRLDRIELPEAASFKLTIRGQSILMVESGSVHVSMRSRAQSNTVTLETGQAVLLLPGADVELSRAGDAAARLIRFSAQVVMPVDPTPPMLTKGATSTVLWTENLPALANGSWTVSFGTIRLPAGAEGQLALRSGTTLLVSSESGGLQMETSDGIISKLDENFWPSPIERAAPVDAGQAVEIKDTQSLDLRSESGDVIWVVSIVPSSSGATPAASPVAERALPGL